MNLKEKRDRLVQINDALANAPTGAGSDDLYSERQKLMREIAEHERPASPFTTQVGGTHYVGMAMQPFQFAMQNQWDSGAFSILKYVSRHRSKAGLIDVRKARHFVDLRQAEMASVLPGTGAIPMQSYVDANGLSGLDAEALMALEGWVERRLPETTVMRLIDEIVAEYEGRAQESLLL